MRLDLLKEVNRLWTKIYPYLASQIVDLYGGDVERVLELGPFSGGISFELVKRHGVHDVILAEGDPEVLKYLEEEIRTRGFSSSIGTKQTAYHPLMFQDGEFDLVVCRGAFFFLDEEGRLLQEIYRVLRKGGLAFAGGGFGKDTPRSAIDEIAEESRSLNDLLGRKRIAVDNLERIINRAGLSAVSRIVREGGLWVVLER